MPHTKQESRLMRLFDLILDRIESVTDYFIAQHITLSEGFIFAISASRAIWFTVFGVNMSPMPTDSLLSQWGWIPVFWVLTVSHAVTFFFTSKLPRAINCIASSLLWMTLALLVAMTQLSSPAF